MLVSYLSTLHHLFEDQELTCATPWTSSIIVLAAKSSHISGKQNASMKTVPASTLLKLSLFLNTYMNKRVLLIEILSRRTYYLMPKAMLNWSILDLLKELEVVSSLLFIK